MKRQLSLLLLTLTFLPLFIHGAIPPSERAALIALYNSTSGDGWTYKTGWKGNNNAPDGFSQIGSEGTWKGVRVYNDHVQNLELYSNNLVGTIPAEIGNLPYLSTVYLSNNKLSGSIPPEFGNLSRLYSLYLTNNQLSGSIPPELGNMSNMQYLMLDKNLFSGSIPAALGNLSKLIYLYLGRNQLTGSIPVELANLSNLSTLSLEYNQLSGSIPPELGNLSRLYHLTVYINNLTGPIPPELGKLTNLAVLILGRNKLSGTIPDTFSNLINMQYLCLEYDGLSGPIPEYFGNFSNMYSLDLCGNKLTGNIPSSLGRLSNLKTLSLSDNDLTGSIPPEFCNLTKLEYLALGQNDLPGPIPQYIANFKNLWLLDLCQMGLNSEIPPEFGYLTKLTYLCLSSNGLPGTIPDSFRNLINLEVLQIGWNNFTGPFPDYVVNFPNLRVLNVEGCRLTGNLPADIGKLTKLTDLRVGYNILVGRIPYSITQLANLNPKYCTVSQNGFYTDDEAVSAVFSRIHHPGWASWQTIAPTNLSAAGISSTSIKISWTPMKFHCITDGYIVYSSASPGGPWTEAGIVKDSRSTTFEVKGLNPKTRYYFIMKSFTDPYSLNRNKVISDFSEETTGETLLPDGTHLLTVESEPDTGALITVTPNDTQGNGAGTTTFTRIYNENENISLSAPESFNGKHFLKWVIDGVDVNTPTHNITMNTDHKVKAVYINLYVLNVNSTPETGVDIEITASPSGSGGGKTNIVSSYYEGTQLTISAPLTFNGKNFSKWIIDGVDNANRVISVTMNGNHTVTAVYVAQTYALTVQSTPVTGVGITVAPVDNSNQGNGNTNFTRSYNQGTTVTLTAPASFNDKIFSKWIIDGVDNSNRIISVSMNGNHTVTAVYIFQTYSLTVQSTPVAGVGITVTPVDNSSQGNGNTNFTRSYNQGTTVTLTAPASINGQNFSKWVIDGVNNANRVISVSMNGNHTVTAVYVVSTLELKVQSFPKAGVSITVAPADNSGKGNGVTNFSRLYNYGTVVTLTAPARYNGKNFLRWSIDGTANTNKTISVTMNTGHTVVAVYEYTAYTLSVQTTEGSGDLITVSPADINGQGDGIAPFTRSYLSGTVVTLIAPATFKDKKFAEWKVDGKTITAGTTVVVTMDGNHKAFAYYTMPEDPGLVVRPVSMSFSYKLKGAIPASQIMRVVLNGYSASWTASSNASWLKVTPSTGNTDGEVVVSIVPTGLTAKTYKGTITVTAPGVPHSPQTVSVTLTVTK